VEARPGWGAPLEHLLDGLEVLDRRAEMVATARRAVAAAPTPETYRELGRALLPEEPDQAISALRSAVLAGGGPLAIGQLSDGLLIAGRLDDAEAEARGLLAPEVPARWQLEGYHQLLKVRALQGRRREVLRLLDQIPAPIRAVDLARAHEMATWTLAFSGGDPGRLWLEARSWGSTTAAIPLAYAGDLPHAAELARGLSASAPIRRNIVECLQLWRRGDLAGAARRLEEITASRQPDWKLPWFFLAAVRAELRRDRDALDAARRFQRTVMMELPHAFSLPRARLIAARSLERLGERDDALREVDRLLALWKDADPDLPELAEARALRARLQGGGRRTGR
jgi:tetratricopeptide (TPR) repeat protein